MPIMLRNMIFSSIVASVTGVVAFMEIGGELEVIVKLFFILSLLFTGIFSIQLLLAKIRARRMQKRQPIS